MLHREVAKLKIETANLTTAVRCISLTDWLLSLLFERIILLKIPNIVKCYLLWNTKTRSADCREKLKPAQCIAIHLLISSRSAESPVMDLLLLLLFYILIVAIKEIIRNLKRYL